MAANPIQTRRAQSAGRASALANMQMPPPGQPAGGQLQQQDEEEEGNKSPQNAQDSLFGEVQAQFARPANLQKIRARGTPPSPARSK